VRDIEEDPGHAEHQRGRDELADGQHAQHIADRDAAERHRVGRVGTDQHGFLGHRSIHTPAGRPTSR
jgi:hypothetical protein